MAHFGSDGGGRCCSSPRAAWLRAQASLSGDAPGYGAASLRVLLPPTPRHDDAWVDNDIGAAVRDVLEHLARSGARRIGVLLPRHDDAYPDLVRHSYEDWCQEHGQPVLVESYPISRYASASTVGGEPGGPKTWVSPSSKAEASRGSALPRCA